VFGVAGPVRLLSGSREINMITMMMAQILDSLSPEERRKPEAQRARKRIFV
jgi:hypothetical protein